MALHDERAGVRVEGIGVDLEQAVLGVAEDERERVDRQVGSGHSTMNVEVCSSNG